MELSIQEQHFDRRSKIIMLAIAFLQGLLLYLLHLKAIKKVWPFEYDEVSFVLNLLIIFIPTTIILSYRRSQSRLSYWFFIASIALVLIIIGVQQGSLIDENAQFYGFFNWFFDSSNVFIIFLLWFMVCFFLKGFLHEKKLLASYPSLFGFSWHNYLAITLSYIFAWIFFGILMLWAGLFKVVEIHFFEDLFEEKWFLYPVMTTVFAYGLILFRTQINAVGTIQRILRILLKALLPILVVVAIMFVAVLPFTGVSLIWDKGFGSGMILGFIYVTLFFFNAVYQDGSENPYSEKVSEFIKYALIVLLVFCALCFYGFGLRVEQYGWTEDRLWLAILTVISTTFVVLYSLIILFKKQQWSALFGKVNTVMAVVVIVILFLLLTPIMDLKRISANSQYNRLINGEVAADEFDFAHMSKLSKYGKQKLNLLKENDLIKSKSELMSELNLALENKLSRYNNNTLTFKQQKKLINIYPEGRQVDKGVWEEIRYSILYGCKKKQCFILLHDMNDDQQDEYLFFKKTSQNEYEITYIEKRERSYHKSNALRRIKLNEGLIEKIKQQQISLKPSKLKDLYIGDQRVPIDQHTN